MGGLRLSSRFIEREGSPCAGSWGPWCCNLEFAVHRQRDGLRCEAEAKERAYGHGFGLGDPRDKWESIHIPAVMVSEDDGKWLVSMMD